MLKYKLFEENDDIISYRYFPNGREDFGTITMNKKTAELINVEVAKNDKFKQFYFHMIREIERFRKADDYLKDGYVAWY